MQPFAHSLHEKGERIGRVKARKFTGLDKDNLVNVCTQAKRNKGFNNLFASGVKCSAISRKAELHNI